MTQINLFQDLIARIDLHLPWLLPSLEAIELTVPATVRLLIFVPLLAALVVVRYRRVGSAARGFHPLAL